VYTEQFNYDLAVIQEPLDSSPRAKARSPAWQKCLVLDPKIAKGYERVIWVDADIIINPSAPSITSGVPIEKIGATDEHVFPSAAARMRIIHSLVNAWANKNPEIARNWASFLDPAEWHAFAGLPRKGSHIVQTGVLVLSPAHHRHLLEHVYYSYEDIGGEPMNYEMRPLSYEIQKQELPHWIDSRFNALIGFLLMQERIVLKNALTTAEERSKFLQAAFQQNYFLHFSGQHQLMEILAGIRPNAI
jgi:hypothetical protein